MMNNKKVSTFFALAMMAESFNDINNYGDSTIKEKKIKPLPKGCQKYFFNEDGLLVSKDENFIFECISINEKNAFRKFKKSFHP